MVISPFSSLAGKARSAASAPQAGEACVLTDQEIEVRRLPKHVMSARRKRSAEHLQLVKVSLMYLCTDV